MVVSIVNGRGELDCSFNLTPELLVLVFTRASITFRLGDCDKILIRNAFYEKGIIPSEYIFSLVCGEFFPDEFGTFEELQLLFKR